MLWSFRIHLLQPIIDIPLRNVLTKPIVLLDLCFELLPFTSNRVELAYEDSQTAHKHSTEAHTKSGRHKSKT
jgi:hypothetical protein